MSVLPRRCKERSELRCLVSCIYLFSNKYNWLCVFRWGVVRQRKTGAEAGLMLGSDFFVVCWLGILWRRLQRCVV
ncbi:hypothetical protein GZ804_004908 [Escherichia coli]|nr:hypothetical protein [Escherichia coli]